MIALPDLLEPIVASLTYTATPTETTYDSIKNTTTFKLCCTGGLRPCSIVYVNDIKYSVLSVVPDESITIKGTFVGTSFALTTDPPFYLHGTIRSAGGEVAMIRDGHDKYPMVYLYEPITERHFGKESSIDYEAEIRLFFLDITDFQNFKTNEHYLYAINQMRWYALEFLKALQKKTCTFGEVEDYRLTSYALIGTDVLEAGVIKNIFADNLSGVELILTLPVLKNSVCKPCTC